MVFPDAVRLKRGRAAVIVCPREDCEACIKACGFRAIERGEDGLPYSDPSKCVGCGGCAAICPDGAIGLVKHRGGSEYELTFPFDGDLPEIDDTVSVKPFRQGAETECRVIQVIPRRPRTEHALVRGVVSGEELGIM